jgi:putative addiction module killer protein
MYTITHYLDDKGHDLFADWLTGLRDLMAKVRIAKRIDRLGLGNFGDCKFVGDGVWELRIDHGPGYRVYYTQAGKQLLLLLVGGDKRTQTADIDAAKGLWADWQQRD